MLGHGRHSFDGVFSKGHSDQHDTCRGVVADLKVERREQLPLQLIRRLGEVGLEQRDHAEQVRVIVAGRWIGLHLGQLAEPVLALGLQLGEARLQAAGKFRPCVAVLDLSDQPLLLIHDRRCCGLECMAAGLPLRLGLPAGGRQVGSEEFMPLRAEDPPLKQIMNRIQQRVLPDPDDLRMAGEAVFPAAVVTIRLAGVIHILGFAAGLGLAEHPAITLVAVDERPQPVDVPGLRMAVPAAT
ncbi:hypothetical protein C1I98_35515 [Spongiactinospora gelatinilytica]|uniref:Uncharacterized protein n=1 Tax=Spongiactinospora gelatinilytica TaxID=2666298 RepID=A0A2W2GCP0_9ACTN|nr:hypothetical protein C1I98_35515 [Spongiactinospora gelatinilytica]